MQSGDGDGGGGGGGGATAGGRGRWGRRGRLAALLLLLGRCALLADAESSSGKMSGPYEISVEKVGECENVGEGLFKFTCKMSKANKTHYSLDIDWSLDIDFTDNMKAYIKVLKWTPPAGWLDTFNYLSEKPCGDCIKHGKHNFKDFMKLAGLPAKCPIKKGKFRSKGLILQDSLTEFPEMPYGKFKLSVTYKSGIRKLGCWSAIFHFNENNGNTCKSRIK